MLNISGLSVAIKRRGEILKAVDDVSFSINEGEILGLAGESGCGKTMSALSIVNLLPQNVKIHSGKIIFNNQDLATLSEKELCRIRGKEISFIFQEARQSLNPLMRVGRQITEKLELCGSVDKNVNKDEALDLLEVLGFDEPEKIFDSYPHQLSGGMCQRVMAAIAAAGKPKLLLADEPSSSLDIESQQRIISLLLRMNKELNTSILLISHDLSIIQKYCSRFLVMYAGKIVEEGPSSALFSPLHPYTRALTLAIPNKDKKGQDLENIPGKVPSIEDRLSGCPFSPRCKKAQSICAQAFPKNKIYHGGHGGKNTEGTEEEREEEEKGKGEGRKVYCYFPETSDSKMAAASPSMGEDNG